MSSARATGLGSTAPALAAVVVATVLAGCGSSDPTPAPTTSGFTGDTVTGTAGETTSAPLTAQETYTSARTTSTEPDVGDEQGIRVPATFTLRDGRLRPAPITVAPFLPIELHIAADGTAHVVVLATVPRQSVTVPATGSVTVRLPGQRKGTYTAAVDGGRAQPALVAIDDAGP